METSSIRTYLYQQFKNLIEAYELPLYLYTMYF